VLQLISSLLSTISTVLGIGKSLRPARSASSSHAANPFTSLVYRWSGPANTPSNQELLLRVGNQEPRTIIVSDIFWSSRASRVKWSATYDLASADSSLQQGQGMVFALEPNGALGPVADTRYCKHFINKLRLICGLRLVVFLQSGESIRLRAPQAYRSFLAGTLGFGWVGRSAVFLHGFAWP
jgi:hypothetical protein